MIPLFGQPEADGKRDVLEGLMISLALQLFRINTSVCSTSDAGRETNEPRSVVDRERESDVSVG
jgi:hypothetical protein